MDYIKILKADLEKGYSKSDLERLIGLPKNNLSGILKGDRKLSPKSKLKIEIWEKTIKPSPLELNFEKQVDKIFDNPEFKEGGEDLLIVVDSDTVNTKQKAANNGSKFRHYDYSAMPKGLMYSAQQKWKAQARIEQDKLNNHE